VPLSPPLPGKGGIATLKSSDTCGLYLEGNQVRMTCKTICRPQTIPEAAVSYRLGEFALGGRLGNGCFIQILVLCSLIHSSHYLYVIANTEIWMGKIHRQQFLKLNPLWTKSLHCYLCEHLPAA